MRCNLESLAEQAWKKLFAALICWVGACGIVCAQPSDEVRRLPPHEEVPAPQPLQEPPPQEDFVDESVEDVVAPPWYTYDVLFDSETWESSFEIGINGTTGNAETMSFRTGAKTKHKTDGHTMTVNFNYARTQADGVETQHNALLGVRSDWDLFLDSLWSMFLKQQTEYDEFKAWDVRLSGNAGLGYFLVKEDNHEFKLRFGGGFSQEIGGPDDDIVPEAVFGSDIETKLTDRQKVEGTFEYFPEWADWNDFRIESKFSWSIQLSTEKNLSLKLSVIDRYDSTPEGRRPNDLDYALLLLWKL